MRVENAQGRIVWMTGLSGAGKTTICTLLTQELDRRSYRVKVLDGDELRKGISSDLGFSSSDRSENVRRAVHLARLLAEAGSIVLVALITPFQAMREMVRASLPEMIEVFVDAPLAVCEQRDPKGLYKMARAGEINDFTGVHSVFERPLSPDIICRTDQETAEVSAAKILTRLFGRKEDDDAATRRRQTIAVDFDGVIANYEGWKGDSNLGTLRLDVVSALHSLRAEGWKIIVHTTRDREVIQHYLGDANVPFDDINANTDYVTGGCKPVATVYWDDRAVRYSGDALQDLLTIRSFRTWSGRT